MGDLFQTSISSFYFQQVGCDGIVGSRLRKDHCGVCGGDNDSCRIIAGIYTRTHHRYGYQQITQIPKGACHINVTELARSRNYLGMLSSVVRLTDSPDMIIAVYHGRKATKQHKKVAYKWTAMPLLQYRNI